MGTLNDVLANTESALAALDGKVVVLQDPSGDPIIGRANASGQALVEVAGAALPAGAATEATLSALSGKVTACNTGAVTVSGSALPSGAATESTLSTLSGKVTACNTGAVTVAASALPSGAATDTELALLLALLGAQRNATAPNVTTATQRLLEVARDGSLRVNADLCDFLRQMHLVASTAAQQVACVRTPPTYPFDGLWVATDGVVVYGQPRGRILHVLDGLTFADATKWTGSGADWAVSGNKATHTASGAGGDELVATIGAPLLVGVNYLLYLKGTKSAGTSLTGYVGSTAGTAITANSAFEFVQVLACATGSTAKIVATDDCACEVTHFGIFPCTPVLANKQYQPFALSEILGVAASATPTTLIVATGCEVHGLYRRVPGVADIG